MGAAEGGEEKGARQNRWLAALVLVSVAYMAHFFAVFISFDLCSRPATQWGMLPVPRNLPEIFRILGGMTFSWAPSIAIYFLLSSLRAFGSLRGKIGCLAVSLSVPTIILFGFIHLVSTGSGYSEWGGQIMMRDGRPTMFSIRMAALEVFLSWSFLSIAYLAAARGQRTAVTRKAE